MPSVPEENARSKSAATDRQNAAADVRRGADLPRRIRWATVGFSSYSRAMFESIKTQLATVTGKLSQLRRFL